MEKTVNLDVKTTVKAVLGIATSIGAGAVAGAILKNQDLSSLKGLGKLCAGIGIVGITGAVADAASESMSGKIDGIFSIVDSAKQGAIEGYEKAMSEQEETEEEEE